MDGVIVDSTRLHTAAWDVYLRKHGLELADVGNRMLGKHNDAIVGDFFSNGSLTRDEIVRHGAGKRPFTGN
jgi:beta-phosphoglucomutase-like phosphatase (HAD superfamily)